MELIDKVCLIAGASGALGSSVAEAFWRAGAQVAVTYHSRCPNELLAKLNAETRRVPVWQMDVTQFDSVRTVVADVQTKFGRIDVLVNCTGVYGPIGPTHTLSEVDWVLAIQANLVGSFYLAHAVLPRMLEQRRGNIIHFSGGGAAYGRPYFTAYSASKAALVRFTESLALEIAESNIRVNAIAPGPVKSRMWEELRQAGLAAGRRALEELSQMDEGGGVTPDRAAKLAVFLASDASTGITGRLVSAVFDDWEHLEGRIPKLQQSDAWRLRRVPLD